MIAGLYSLLMSNTGDRHGRETWSPGTKLLQHLQGAYATVLSQPTPGLH